MARVSDNAQSKHVYSKHVEEISEGHAPEASEEEKEEKMNQGKRVGSSTGMGLSGDSPRCRMINPIKL